MNLAETIKQLCDEMGVTMAELSRRTGQSPQNLGKKIRNGTLGFDEFLSLTEALGAKFEYTINLPDGSTAGSLNETRKLKSQIGLLEAQLLYEKRSNEYLSGLNRYVRAAFHTIAGNTDIALKHLDNSEKVEDCLRKIEHINIQLKSMLGDEFMSDGNEERIELKDVNGKRVLLVEDNDLNREVTRELLEENGMSVEEADDGDVAVEKIRKAAPGYYDFVLMDIQMLRMDGYEATRLIRTLPNRIRANVPIIAMTANAMESDRELSMKAGMDAHLTKPLNVDKMLHVMSKFL